MPPVLDYVPGAEAAAELGVSRGYLSDLVNRGKLRGTRPTPRRLLIPRADLDAFRRRRLAHDIAANKAEGLTVAEVAQACNVGRDTVRRWIRLGLLPGTLHPAVCGFRAYRVKAADLQAFLAAGSVE